MRSFLTFLAIAVLAASCAGGPRVSTSLAKGEPTEGVRYRLILYSSMELRAAFLDIEGDGYELEPIAPEASYRIHEGLGPGEALEKGRAHISKADGYDGYEVRNIRYGETLLGYEMRPMFETFIYGVPDITDISYNLVEGGIVRVWVSRNPFTEEPVFRMDKKR